MNNADREEILSPRNLRELDQFLRVRDEHMSLVTAHGLITCLISLPKTYYQRIDHEQIFFNNHLATRFDKYIPQIKQTLAEILKITVEDLNADNEHDNFRFLFSNNGFSKTFEEINLRQVQQWCTGYVVGLHLSGLFDDLTSLNKESATFSGCSTIMFYADLINQNNEQHAFEDKTIHQIKLASLEVLPKTIRTLYSLWSQGMYDFNEQSQYEQNLCPCGSKQEYAKCCRLEALAQIIH
jgi:uncharacterized protein YecA (UPF0149 family)